MGEKENFTLKSGRTISCNKGLISVSENGTLFEGYDSHLRADYQEGVEDDMGRTPDFTKEEAREIAEMMVQRWTLYRDGLDT